MALDLDKYITNEDAYDLKRHLERTLEVVVSVFESYNMPLPKRRYYMLSTPVIDCEQVVVSLINVYLGLPGDEGNQPIRCNSGTPRTAVVQITIAREQTVLKSGRAPGPTELMQDADVGAVDAWILFSNMEQFDVLGSGVIATVMPEKIAGGYQVVTLQLTTSIG